MARFTSLVLLVACVVFVKANVFRFDVDEDREDFNKLLQILSKPRTLDRFVNDKLRPSGLKVKSFSWGNCGSSSDPIQVHNFTLSPDPIKLPGDVQAGFSVTFKESFGAPLQAKLEIKKKVLVWIPIPCVDNIGSCTYDDVCSFIPLSPGDPCPYPLSDYGIPCTCPFPAGNFYLPPATYYLDPSSLKIPTWLEDGDYQATVLLNIIDNINRVFPLLPMQGGLKVSTAPAHSLINHGCISCI
ncbi:unnamed protein product [Owenia fusiformis]|uniref:MD-2-related lipid-recognition domain-containing protein n=1 Tax=Owenia fusiformis TaxID=6347 RepID=A0A8S4NBB2_OWEFU|nr:unnamed protein product [Owenia fusiformis]